MQSRGVTPAVARANISMTTVEGLLNLLGDPTSSRQLLADLVQAKADAETAEQAALDAAKTASDTLAAAQAAQSALASQKADIDAQRESLNDDIAGFKQQQADAYRQMEADRQAASDEADSRKAGLDKRDAAVTQREQWVASTKADLDRRQSDVEKGEADLADARAEFNNERDAFEARAAKIRELVGE